MEQLLYGVDIKDEKPVKAVLAASPGLGAEISAEIARLCDNWGTPPPLGLEHPALMSFRLSSSLPGISGRLFTVIRASRGLQPLFHAVVLSEGAYATFMRNPFAVAQCVTFRDEWNPAVKLPQLQIDCDPTRPLVEPAADKSDLGLVDEAVLKLIAEGKLQMPIEQATRQSDRCLALIIACLPEKMRKEMRFASFATSEANNYTLAGIHADGCVFAGWQRMMMAWLAGDYVEEVDSYIEEIRKYLASGDVAGLARTSQRHQFHSGPGAEAVEKPRRDTVSGAMPVKGPRPAPARIRAPQASVARSPVPGPISGRALPVARPKPSRLSPLERKNPNPTSGGRPRGSARPNPIRGAAVVLLLAMAVTAGVMWKMGKTLAESLEWANLQGIMGENPRTERAPTLLEVVDVGAVYSRQLKLVTGSGKGLNPSLDKGRRKALNKLREQAAVPLNQQVELFAKLATDGIQQASRPDREAQRMQSLAAQGLVLENELARLELAWYSLAGGTFWQDIPSLPDQAVIARRDSLAKADKGVLQDARNDLETVEAKAVLDQTRGHVSGMASLLTLFDAPSYTQEWENKLGRAAAQVAPSASRMTRAYANSAFAMVRLKKAERSADQISLPYRDDLEDQSWPVAEIRSILTNLRAQTVMFAPGRAPALLTATVDLYAALKTPAALAAEVAVNPGVLADLAANRAVRFDPRAYADFLERIRYEAALLDLGEADDPELIPEQLYAGGDRDLVIGFRNSRAQRLAPAAWDSLAPGADSPFFNHWAGILAEAAKVDLGEAQEAFDADWGECRLVAVRLQEQAAAGHDWTHSWTKMRGQARGILDRYTDDLAADPERSLKLADLAVFLEALEIPLPLPLRSGTIRLDQDRMPEDVKARLEVRIVPDGQAVLSDKFQIGPAAPEGTGWVGNVSLDQTLEIRPEQGLEIRIISEDRGETLLSVSCPSLAEGTGPAGLLRPRSGGRGTVSLRFDSGYWKSLRVPDMGVIF
jgi:hypothetical protein